MGLAPAAHVLFNKFMTFNPKNPDWVNRDRFVLSYATSLRLNACGQFNRVSQGIALATHEFLWTMFEGR